MRSTILAGITITLLAVLVVSGKGPAWIAAHYIAMQEDGQVVTLLDTGSMEPSLTSEHVLVFRPKLMDDIRSGEVVAYRLAPKYVKASGGIEYVVHRVISNDGQMLVTKGDANGDIDPWPVKESQVLGVLVSAIRY